MAIRFEEKSEPGKPPKKADATPRANEPLPEAPEGELPLDEPSSPFAKPKPKKRGK